MSSPHIFTSGTSLSSSVSFCLACCWIRSNLFTPIMIPFPALSIFPAMARSWCVTPSIPSIIRMQMSDASMAFCVRTVDQNSMLRSILPGLRRPAVSKNRKDWSVSSMCCVSMVSLVVPAVSDTMALFVPISAFNRLLFPTFGRPTIASFIWF